MILALCFSGSLSEELEALVAFDPEDSVELDTEATPNGKPVSVCS